MTKNLPLVRTSERSTFKRCRQRWEWAYIDHLALDRPQKALDFGKIIHSALEAYYVPGRKRGPHPAGTFLQQWDEFLEEVGYSLMTRDYEDDESEFVEMRDLGEEMLTDYVDHWQDEDSQIEVIAPEAAISADIMNRQQNAYMAKYLMQIDAVVYHHGFGRYLFWDHKTVSGGVPDPDEKYLDEQCGTYWTLGPDALREAGVIGPDVDISGFYYNWLVKKMADKRPRNHDGHFLNKASKKQRDTFVAGLKESGAGDREIKKVDAWLKMNPRELPKEAHEYFAGAYPGDVSKTQPSTERFVRYPVYYDEGPREQQMHRIRGELHDMALARKGKIAIYKNPMHGGPQGCGSCPFYDMCTLHEAGSDWQELRDLTMRIADPYEQYRDELEIGTFSG